MGNISTNHKKIKLDDIVPPKIELPDDVIYDMLNILPDKTILEVSKLNKRSGQLAKDVMSARIVNRLTVLSDVIGTLRPGATITVDLDDGVGYKCRYPSCKYQQIPVKDSTVTLSSVALVVGFQHCKSFYSTDVQVFGEDIRTRQVILSEIDDHFKSRPSLDVVKDRLYNFDIEFSIEFPYTTQCNSLGHYFDEDKNSKQNGRLKLIVKDKTYETNNATFYLQEPRDGIVHGKAKVNVDGLTVS